METLKTYIDIDIASHDKEYINQITSCNWVNLYYGIVTDLINKYEYKKIAEVGIGYGLHAANILKNTDIDKLYLIDPLKFYENDLFPINIQKMGGFETLLKNITILLNKYGNKYNLIRKPSNLIDNTDISDNSLDLIFIDGDHSYQAVLKDLQLFYKKIRVGGMIVGDDYMSCHPGTKKAVDEFVATNNLKLHLLSKDTSNIYPIYVIMK
jgi:hypothetical protein